MKQAIKRTSATLLLLMISFAVCALLGELLVRIAMKDRIVLFPRYHTDATYGDFEIRRFRPNSSFRHSSIDGEWQFHINSQGFRSDRDFEYAKKPQRIRILSLGDSHTAGYEVGQDETYSTVLEANLQASGVDVEVLNTGISGFGTAEQLVYLANEGIKYDPDFVILGFYANDLQDNVKSGLYALEEGQLTVMKNVHLPGVRIQNILYDYAAIRWLSENSYFFSFGFNLAYEVAKSILSESAKEDTITEYAIPVGEFTDYEMLLAAELVAELANFCREGDVKLIVIDIPVPTNDNEIAPSIPNELRDVFEESSDAVIHSRDALAALVDDGLPIHVEHGHRHISRHSHRLFAQAIAAQILELMPANAESVATETP